MEFKKNIKNSLLKRQEISFLVEAQKNPGFDEMKKKISEELKKDEDLIDVYGISGKFGRSTFLVKANIYETKKDFDSIKILNKTKKQRKTEAEETKKAAEEAKKAKDETKKETPAETSTETISEEAKVE